MTRTLMTKADQLARKMEEIGARASVLGALVQGGKINPLTAAAEVERLAMTLTQLKAEADRALG